MEDQITWKEKLKYQFDNTFSQGTIAMIGWLGVLSLVIIVIAATILSIFNIRQPGSEDTMTFIEAAWEALMRTLDSGTMGGDEGWGFRIVMLLVTLGGIFVISTLIGVLSTGIEAKLDELRKGRSRVIESNHTVILGWSDQIFTVISELVQANANQKGACIVVLADQDKVEMEDRIRDMIDQSEVKNKTRIICRSGRPMDMNDLRLANLNAARSIVVLAPDGEEPDAEVIKTVLAITHSPFRRKQPYHVVATLSDPRNMDVAQVVGKDEVEWIVTGDLVARIMAQTCRQSGLSVVYKELLDFGGDEVYFTEQTALVGKTFGETLSRFEKNLVMGYAPANGAVSLNPPMDTKIEKGDRLVVMAEDDDKIALDGIEPSAVPTDAINSNYQATVLPERTLILGWNERGTAILRELDNYVAPGSEVVAVADLEDFETNSERFPDMQNQVVKAKRADTTSRKELEALELGCFQHVILLSYLDDITTQQADARTLVTLLHLRDMADRCGYQYSIVSEMLDVRNRDLADVTRADDFVVSDQLISLMLSQVSENKYLNAVFTDLFDPDGSEVYVRAVEAYVETGKTVPFYTVVEAARRRGEVAMGYRIQSLSRDAGQSYGVTLNPKKSDTVTFHPGDRIIVLAES